MMLPFSLFLDQPWTLAMPPLVSVLSVLALALVSTAFAYILYFRIVTLAGATNASLVTLLVPPGAILLGFVFLGERLSLPETAGIALIGLGLVILDGRAYRRFAAAA
jgi:drug/metabolite transporter (DMT)-like permease